MVKRELDISSYMNYRVTSTLMVNPISCNFNPNDGVNTKQIINWDGDIPDYIVASETGDDINSRWFVIEAARKRGQQYELTLYRDTIVDYYESIKEADIFIEKAMIRDSDTSNPLLFNTENMSFNQIKYNDVKLYDKTKCPWLIGFISKDFKIDGGTVSIPSKNTSSAVPNAFNVPSFAASEFSKNDGKWQVPPFQKIGNVGYEYVLTSPNTDNLGTSILNATKWRYILTTYSAVQNGAFVKYTDSSPFNKGGYSAILQTDMQTSELYNPNPKLGGKSRFDVYNDNSINWGNPYGLISIQLQDYLNKKYKVGLDSWFESYYYPNEILVHSEDTGKIYKGTRSTISAREIIPTTFLETSDADALQLMNTIRNSFSTSIPDSTVEMKVNNINSTSFKITSNGEFYKYDFKEVSAYNYTVNITQRDSLTDQPFDMFCMPYSDEFEYVNPQGNVIGTSSKESNLNIARSISKQGGTAGIYDIQLVPYCPIINNVYEEDGKPHISLDGISYTEIKQNEGNNQHTIGYLYWANKSKGSFNINYTIPDVLNASEKKVKSMTEFCRLTSPSQGSEFIFDPMKNHAANSFLIQSYSKPYQSSIRIVPTWNQSSLYATSNMQTSQDGLIIMEEMSLSQVTDKWAEYELNNKNYRSAFQRQIQSMELDKNWSLGTGIANTLVGSVTGAAGGFMISGGNPIGAVVGGVASLGGGITDLIQQQALKNDAIDLTKDNFNFMLGNIKALPLQLNKTSSFNPSNSLVPILEFWSATDKEKNIAENKIIFNGMTIGAIDNLYNYKTIGNAYFKGQLIRIQNINDDFHLVNTIAKELHQGIYLN